MKNVELTGTKRPISGTTGAKGLRRNKQVPCVLYGGQDIIHFSVEERALNKIVHSPDAFSVELNIDGEKRTALLHDKQFQPLTDAIIHADFLETVANKEAKVSLNVRLKGQSAGVRKGGKMTQSLRRLRVKGMPDKLPEILELDVTTLELGENIQVKDIVIPGMTILEKPNDVVVSVKVPKKVETPAETAAAVPAAATAAAPAAAATDKKAEPAKK
jgi:large subunit ribosomal protein L25